MKIVIKNSFLDLLAFGKHIKIREKLFDNASSTARSEAKINMVSKQIHPVSQDLFIEKVIEESPDIKSFILRPFSEKTKIAPFRAGQYIVLSSQEDGLILRRPYSISSSASDSVRDNYYRITVKLKAKENNGYFSDHAFHQWKAGTRLSASGPQGYFYYDSLRDASTLVCIAGGSGITPFCSIIPEVLKKNPKLKIYLFYGFNKAEDEVFSKEFSALASEYPESFFYNPMAMDVEGVISSEIIKERLPESTENVSFFICGPPALHTHMNSELASLSLKSKFIRRESYGSETDHDDEIVKKYRLILKASVKDVELIASSDETILTALERAGVNAPSLCRAGECGWCRTQLLSGEISMDHGLTGIRKADRKFGWIHPCVSYPREDLVLRVPENPE